MLCYRGIVPTTCDELFKTMGQNDDPGKRYEVMFSMLEIYNEQVWNLVYTFICYYVLNMGQYS